MLPGTVGTEAMKRVYQRNVPSDAVKAVKSSPP